MPLVRRRFLTALGAALAAPLVGATPPALLPAPKGRRVVVLGGGWGGLAAARRLRQEAPDLEVVLVEKNARFWSCPLSNKWLADRVETAFLDHDYGAAARAWGYTFIQAEATAVDRERRRVITAAGALDYDWLVLAAGIRHDYGAWFGDDRRALEHTRRHYAPAWQAGPEFPALKARLQAFQGGDLVMALPPMPYRCPPAPYERAVVIAHRLKAGKIPGRLVLLDPNPMPAGFARVFAEQYGEQVVYVPDARVRTVDPFRKVVSTDVEDFSFSEAILMPPQQAGDILWQADLVGRDSQGRPTGWADPDPVRLHARDDDRVYLVGDLLGPVSPLFGHYPKTGQLASRLGAIAARHIAARARGEAPARLLPDSVCHVLASLDPEEAIRIDTRYRFRGDGLILQTIQQAYDPNPRGEDLAWARGMFGELLAAGG